MTETRVVLIKILAMFACLLVGWVARRRNHLDTPTTAFLSRFTTDVALPALIFTQLLDTLTPAELRARWIVPVLAAGVLLLGQIVGWLGWRLFCDKRQAATFIFIISIANWIYLPLPIVQELYGNDGVQVLLLCNAGVQIYLWTIGVMTLHAGRPDLRAMGMLARNPGLIATAAGILLACLFPGGLRTLPDTRLWVAPHALLDALKMIGSLTIPLSLIATGAQLGGLRTASAGIRPLAGVLLLRLIIVPLVGIGVAWAMHAMGRPLPRVEVMILLIIAMMPVAVSCSILAERFGGDTGLAAQGIFATTLVSLATVPLLFALARRLPLAG